MNENIQYLLTGLIALIIISCIVFYIIKKNKGVRIFYENNKLRHKYFIDKSSNLKKDLETFYYRNGNLNKEQRWVNNMLEGECKIYYPTGELYIQSFYENNLLNGDYKIFDKFGNIIQHEIYQIGKSISIIKELTTNRYNEEAIALNKSIISDEDKEIFESIKETYLEVKEVEETKDNGVNKKGILGGVKKITKVVTGIQAYQNRKSSLNLKQACEIYYDEAQKLTEGARKKLNLSINEFGKYRLESLHATTGRFLGILKDMNKESSIKEYEILDNVGINTNAIQKMERLDMEATNALKSTATVGVLGAAAAMGTPAAVTSAVGALATASTGTAISTLSGAAATNATLAWLGGGSLASGGGGMALGGTVLSGLTMGATAGVGIIAAVLIASTYYSKKLTEAKEFQKEVETHVADMELLWTVLENIKKRTDELSDVTKKLETRLKTELEFLEPLAIDFSTDIIYYNTTFQRVGLLAKSMSELAQTPLLDEEGNTSIKSAQIIQQTNKVLNTKITNHGR